MAKNMWIFMGIFLIVLFSACANQPLKVEVNPSPPWIPDAGTAKEANDCSAFPESLEKCEPFLCKFQHPFTGDQLEKRVLGLKDGRCQYSEQMPNNGRMDCAYLISYLKPAASYYRDVDAGQEGQRTYAVDGKTVDNPIEEALDTGICVISGYG